MSNITMPQGFVDMNATEIEYNDGGSTLGWIGISLAVVGTFMALLASPALVGETALTTTQAVIGGSGLGLLSVGMGYAFMSGDLSDGQDS